VRNIAMAWVFTLPAAALAASLFWLFKPVRGQIVPLQQRRISSWSIFTFGMSDVRVP
jgi:hypothetical protein